MGSMIWYDMYQEYFPDLSRVIRRNLSLMAFLVPWPVIFGFSKQVFFVENLDISSAGSKAGYLVDHVILIPKLHIAGSSM